MFVLTEVYESVAGVDDHEQQAQKSLTLPHDMSEGLVELTICDRGAIKHSLWIAHPSRLSAISNVDPLMHYNLGYDLEKYVIVMPNRAFC